MNLRQGQGTSAVAALVLFASITDLRACAAETLELPEGFPLWQESVQLEAGFGYNDNVALSSFDRQRSPFAMASVEAMLFRLPWNDWQLSLMAVGSDAEYLERSISIDREQNAAVSGEFTYFIGRGWRSVSTLQYVFINQVMDVSTTYGASYPQQVFGHTLDLKQAARKDLGPWWTEFEVSGSRDWFREPLDDFWQAGPRLTLGRSLGDRCEVSLSYQASSLIYDSREETDRAGTPLPGTHLRYLPQSVEMSWQQALDARHRWRNLLRLSFESSEDNGSGYYDYDQYRIAEQVRYRTEGWEFNLQAALAYYDFPNQPVSLTDPRARHRTSLRVALRAEKTLSKHWRAYAVYDHERSFSNLRADRYDANTVTGGVIFAF